MKKLIFNYSMALLFLLISTGCEVAITPLDQNEINSVVNITPVEGNNEITDEHGVAITQLSNLPAQVTLDDVRLNLEGQGSENFKGLVSLVDKTFFISVVPEDGFTVNVDTNFTFVATVYVLDSPSCDKNITIVLDGVNNEPVAMVQEITTSEDNSVVITLTAEDGDNDQLTYSIVSNATNGVVTLQGNNAMYTPNTNYSGTDSFTFRVYDSLEYSETEIVNITVLDTNDAPSITGTPATSVNADSSYNFTPSATDVDVNDTLTFSILNQPIWATFDTATGLLSGIPDNTNVGITIGIEISVTDGQVSRTLPVFDITIVDTTPPSIRLLGANPQTIEVGTAYTELNASTDDGSTVVIDSTAVDTNIEGNYTVTYNATDTAGNPAIEVTRTVEVIAAVDTTPPSIRLLGANPQTIEVGTAYTELNASTDDGSTVVIDSTAVDTNIEGNYTVTYNATDTAGNPAIEVTRTVTVLAETALPSRHLFSWCDDLNGTELWSTDGTAGNTALLKDISAVGSSSPELLININNTYFFSADDGVKGRELWISDGTVDGTVLVKDIYDGNLSAAPNELVDVNGILFFTADDGVKGRELWKSDGTVSGTVLVKDIYDGNQSANPKRLVDVNGTLFFTADDGAHGRELWKSDGTQEGTLLLEDRTLGGSTYFAGIGAVNGLLVFSADMGLFDYQLFSSDGNIVEQVGNFDLSFGQLHFATVNNVLFFSGYDDNNRRELWESDGVTTQMVRDINIEYDAADKFYGSSSPEELTEVNGTLYFTAIEVDGANPRLFISDGTEAGTVVVENADETTKKVDKPNNLISVDGKLYFSRETGNYWRFWRADGGWATQIIEFEKIAGITGISELREHNGIVYFKVHMDTTPYELWAYDTTTLAIPYQIATGCTP